MPNSEKINLNINILTRFIKSRGNQKPSTQTLKALSKAQNLAKQEKLPFIEKSGQTPKDLVGGRNKSSWTQEALSKLVKFGCKLKKISLDSRWK